MAWRSRIKHGRGIHCSRECQYAANRVKLKKPKVKLTCVGCGDEFERVPSSMTKSAGSGKYCTRECRDKHWVGENTPNWQGGSGIYKRGPRWQSIRRAVLKRDNHQCQECGSSDSLHIHHKVPFRMFNDSDAANHEDNLITLCAPCHRMADAGSKWAKIGDGIIQMPAGGYAWKLAKNMQQEAST